MPGPESFTGKVEQRKELLKEKFAEAFKKSRELIKKVGKKTAELPFYIVAAGVEAGLAGGKITRDFIISGKNKIIEGAEDAAKWGKNKVEQLKNFARAVKENLKQRADAIKNRTLEKLSAVRQNIESKINDVKIKRLETKIQRLVEDINERSKKIEDLEKRRQGLMKSIEMLNVIKQTA